MAFNIIISSRFCCETQVRIRINPFLFTHKLSGSNKKKANKHIFHYDAEPNPFIGFMRRILLILVAHGLLVAMIWIFEMSLMHF